MTLKRFAPLALALCLPAITLNALAGTDERQSSAAAPEAAAPADTPPASATASAKQPEAIPPLPRDEIGRAHV